MISAEIILDTRRKTKNGYPVKVRVYHLGSRSYKYIPENKYQKGPNLKVDPEIAKRMARLDEEVGYCNDNDLSLDASLKVIKEGLPKGKELEIFLLKQRLAELEKGSGVGLLEFFDTFIKETESNGNSTTHFEDTKSQLINFLGKGQDIAMNDIDYEWLNKFILHKKEIAKEEKRTISDTGGISYYLRTMRRVYKEAQRRKSLNVRSGNPFEGLIKNGSKRQMHRVTAEHVKKLFDFEPVKGTRRKSLPGIYFRIDLFLFQFVIGGHYLSDVASLKWDNIQDGRIVFQRYKNRSKPGGGEVIDNMLSDFALSFIDKYGTKDDDRVFSFIPEPDNKTRYKTYIRGYDRSLESIYKALKIPKLTTVTPRYLFRSIAGELLISDIVVMKLQGHKPDGVTHRYQMDLPYKVLDAEHKKVLDQVFA